MNLAVASETAAVSSGSPELSKLQGENMEFTIEREKWLRGEGGETSCLLRKEDGKECCLGQFALACGIAAELITEQASPERIELTEFPDKFRWLLTENTRTPELSRRAFLNSMIAEAMMRINDCSGITDEEREVRLKVIFGVQGIVVRFK